MDKSPASPAEMLGGSRAVRTPGASLPAVKGNNGFSRRWSQGNSVAPGLGLGGAEGLSSALY